MLLASPFADEEYKNKNLLHKGQGKGVHFFYNIMTGESAQGVIVALGPNACYFQPTGESGYRRVAYYQMRNVEVVPLPSEGSRLARLFSKPKYPSFDELERRRAEQSHDREFVPRTRSCNQESSGETQTVPMRFVLADDSVRTYER